jgi:glyoxylase-like metal-dependent hydrolase (beta-lactamase superfamily II)
VWRAAPRLAPGKPIRYVVATHFHDDHLAGVRPYIAAGATILTTPHGAGAVREIAAVRKGMFPDTLDLAPRELRVEGIVLRRVLQDATQRLEIHEAGPSPHVEQMLVVWIPRAGVLYEADLLDLDVAEDGAPMPGTDTRTFASWLDRVGLPVRVIVPAHGRPGNPADLRRALAR